ncbi:sigma-E processing peptidase SpoIIGA [Paenibacillaceae bacterium WGS1546]|uniref:sigma-E processing peptidase SpoIIGA n=1 Tax=Cohnella sp. WGS1546 TaxID=3366810 RepID=UPI00372D71B8
MIVYIDLVFLTNLAVDGTVLLATAKARRFRPSRKRVLFSALLGALYAAAMFWARIPYLYSFGGKLFVSLLMVLIAFGYGGPLKLGRNFAAFYAINFATLGGVIGLSSLLKSFDSPWGGARLTPDGGILLEWQMQLGLFVIAFALSAWLFRNASETERNSRDTERLLWDVEIRIGDGSWKVKALLDTGNRLYDPLTRTPVMVMEAGVWKDRLPDGWSDRLQSESPDRLISELDDQEPMEEDWRSRLRLVPYRSVGGGSRLMLAVKPDAVLLHRGEQPPIQVNRVLIGLDGGTLSSEGTYRAIVHPDMAQADRESSAPSQPA